MDVIKISPFPNIAKGGVNIEHIISLLCTLSSSSFPLFPFFFIISAPCPLPFMPRPDDSPELLPPLFLSSLFTLSCLSLFSPLFHLSLSSCHFHSYLLFTSSSVHPVTSSLPPFIISLYQFLPQFSFDSGPLSSFQTPL